MFTGIVEELGKVRKIGRRGKGILLEVQAEALSQTVRPGDSIAVNGVCLTVMEKRRDSLLFYVSQESLSKTNLSKLRTGEAVNLEGALAMGKPMGGHIVQGHIDGMGRIKRISRKGEEWRVAIAVDKELMPYIVPKGSIAVDGISLTVASLLRDGFEVVVIPYTYRNTNLQGRRVGDYVNIEVDILSKYAVRVR